MEDWLAYMYYVKWSESIVILLIMRNLTLLNIQKSCAAAVKLDSIRISVQQTNIRYNNPKTVYIRICPILYSAFFSID